MENRPMLDLHWFPSHPDLRGAVARLKSQLITRPEQLAPAVVQLANHRMDYLETLKFNRLSKAALDRTPEGWLQVRLALLGSSSVEHLLPPISIGGIRR